MKDFVATKIYSKCYELNSFDFLDPLDAFILLLYIIQDIPFLLAMSTILAIEIADKE